jgi:glycosyltransferase involved in cell wall biosynthesis
MAEIAKREMARYDDRMDAVPKRKAPMISIIIPTYNQARFILEAIDSALAQTYSNKEIIVIDDGCTDNTVELITRKYFDVPEDLKPSNLSYYKKPNGGTASALNYGIMKMRGEYFKWLSSDDVLYKHALQDMVWFGVEDHAAQAKNAIFYTDYDIIDANGAFLGPFEEPKIRNQKTHKEKVDELFQHYYGNASTWLVHISVLNKCGLFDATLQHSEDYDFALTAAALHGVDLIHIPVKTLKYRNHPGMLTNKIGGQLDAQIRANIRRQLEAAP